MTDDIRSTEDEALAPEVRLQIDASSPEVEDEIRSIVGEALRENGLPADAVTVHVTDTFTGAEAAMMALIHFTYRAAWAIFSTVILPRIQRRFSVKQLPASDYEGDKALSSLIKTTSDDTEEDDTDSTDDAA